MKYFVVSDVHGFYTELKAALHKNGFDVNDNNHKLVICGDLMDRGYEAEKLQSFIVELLEKDKVILVRGNHEDLIEEFLNDLKYYTSAADVVYSHHWRNGTVQTALQLTHLVKDVRNSDEIIFKLMELIESNTGVADFAKMLRGTPLFKTIIPKMVNFYETDHHIFVHGWIPCATSDSWNNNDYKYIPDWRNANELCWKLARWVNGMDCAILFKILEPHKTIVCGHWHASFGHANYWRFSTQGDEKRKQLNCDGKEFGKDADHSPFYAEGLIAIDACTAVSKTVNCIVLED